LSTFPEAKRLTIHHLPPGENRAETVLIWRKGLGSPNITALRQILNGPGPVKLTRVKSRHFKAKH
jgi:hypothetical protein